MATRKPTPRPPYPPDTPASVARPQQSRRSRWTAPAPEGFMTVKQCAEALGVHPNRVYVLAANNVLSSVQMGKRVYIQGEAFARYQADRESAEAQAREHRRRVLSGQIGGLTTHARHDSRRHTEPARAAALARFEREVDPQCILPAAERARRAERAKRAYFTKLAYQRARKAS